jgi:hypothetical protein
MRRQRLPAYRDGMGWPQSNHQKTAKTHNQMGQFLRFNQNSLFLIDEVPHVVQENVYDRLFTHE